MHLGVAETVAIGNAGRDGREAAVIRQEFVSETRSADPEFPQDKTLPYSITA